MKRNLALLLCCCAALSACTVTPKYKPDTSVTPPAVGHPAPPSTAAQADASEAFTPYASLSIDSRDSLAPGMSLSDLTKACMTRLGYPDAGALGEQALSLDSQPFGPWGYLGGAAMAEQAGISPLDIKSVAVGVRPSGGGGNRQMRAMSKCSQKLSKFSQAQSSGPLGLIETLSNDIQADVQHDPAIRSATRAWAACMAQNGYHLTNPQALMAVPAVPVGGAAQGFMSGSGGGALAATGRTLSPSQRRAELALAVTDANCTQSSDLGGIYFAVKASYEQQIVNLNQQALATAVTQYRTAYEKALATLPR